MNRARREIKTPKRFDEEPPEAPKEVITPAKQIIKVPKVIKSSFKVSLPKKQKAAENVQQNKEIRSPTHEEPPVPPKIQRPPKEQRIVKEPRHLPLDDTITPKIHRPPKEYRPPKDHRAPAYEDVIPNLKLPFWDARTAAEEHEDDNVKELVHCQCSIAEELGLMVQCETCLTWQHAHCLGVEKPEDAPDGYTCQACFNPKYARESMRWAYDQDWLLKGRMKHFLCDPNPPDESEIETLNTLNRLIDDTLRIYNIIHSLRVKARLLATAPDDDAELKLFRVQWPAAYQHMDGLPFIPTVNHLASTPASTISAMVETPDPGDIPAETVAEASLPEIGQLEDVSAILDHTDGPGTSIQPISNLEATPDYCRANLRLHIRQMEEFISIELSRIEEQLTALEARASSIKGSKAKVSFESLRSDLLIMRSYTISRK